MKKKHYYFFILSGLICLLLMALGFWQLQRGREKSLLMQTIARKHHTVLSTTEYSQQLNKQSDITFYQIKLHGFFDNYHHILLDNKIQNRQIGYEVITPFYDTDLQTTFLIDRGFIPTHDRTHLPELNRVIGNMFIQGILILPSQSFNLGKMIDGNMIQWPLRVEFIHIDSLKRLLHAPLATHLIKLAPKDPLGYNIEWQFNTFPPERHYGYALQWFALAATVVVLSVAFYRKAVAMDSSTHDDNKQKP